MGTFSKHLRYREAGEAPNVENVANYGEPCRSLFTSTKLFSFRHHMEITDNSGNIMYTARSKVISLHDKTDVTDRSGNQVAHIERKILSLHERHYVTMASGKKFELSNELFHLYKDITNIEGLGWQLRGNIWGLNFELLDASGNVVAVISQKMLSIHDKYCVDIYNPEEEATVIAILVTLQHMISDRNSAASSSSSSSSSSS